MHLLPPDRDAGFATASDEVSQSRALGSSGVRQLEGSPPRTPWPRPPYPIPHGPGQQQVDRGLSRAGLTYWPMLETTRNLAMPASNITGPAATNRRMARLWP